MTFSVIGQNPIYFDEVLCFILLSLYFISGFVSLIRLSRSVGINQHSW